MYSRQEAHIFPVYNPKKHETSGIIKRKDYPPKDQERLRDIL